MTQDRIVLVSGAEQHSEYVLTTALTIGRNLDSSIYLEDPQVSRRHAIVESTPNGTFVRDLGSGNGTFVGDRRVVECRLTDGDIITIGGVELRFETAEDSGAMDVRFEFDIKGHVESSDADNVFETFFQTPTLATTSEQRHNAQNRLAAIYKANQIISSERDLRNLFHRVLDQIFSLVPAHNGVILLKDEKTGRLTTQCVKSGSDDTAVISSSIVRRAFDGGEAVITYDAADDSRFGGHASIISQNIASAMCAPLTHHNQRLGVLYVDTRGTTNAFTKSDLELLVAFAGPAAIAIRNAQYVDELERAYRDYLIITSNAIEMRDHYTVGHTWRVTHFALEMAKALGWPEEALELCEMGGLLHDVGKIAVSDAILCKRERLTDEEYAMMKIHPERGARMLRDSERLKPLVPYCLYHHERYDGKGYPYELAGEDIPVEGRLIAVADTFDAMTSNRPYRKGLPPESAIAEIEKGRGTQFDPVMVNAIVRCYRDGNIARVIQESLKDEKSIVCPFCSTCVTPPEETPIGGEFECQVCHRRIKLCKKNEVCYGELLAQTP